MEPKAFYQDFKDGLTIADIARKNDTEPEFVESILRAVMVGIDIGVSFARRECAEI